MLTRTWILVAVVVVLAAFPRPARAIKWEMRAGTYVAKRTPPKPVKVASIVILEGYKLRLIFPGASTGTRIEVMGTYKTTATKFSDYHITYTVESVDSVHEEPGQKAPKVKKLDKTRQLGRDFQPKTEYRFTFGFGCSDKYEYAQLCLHDTNEDGSAHVECDELFDLTSECTPPPPRPVDAPLPNAPPDFIPNTDKVLPEDLQ